MLDGENDQNPGVNPGDVIFKIKTQPHPLFVRRGNDLHYKTTITLLEVSFLPHPTSGTFFALQALNNEKKLIVLPLDALHVLTILYRPWSVTLRLLSTWMAIKLKFPRTALPSPVKFALLTKKVCLSTTSLPKKEISSSSSPFCSLRL